MLMSPPGIIPLRYGEGSFIRHREETSHAGAYFIEIRPSPLSIDIDMPEDLTAEILDLLKTLRNSCRNGGWASGGLETVKQGESQRE